MFLVRLAIFFAGIALTLLGAGCGLEPQAYSPNSLVLLVPYVGQGHGIALVQGRQALVFDAGPPEQGCLRQALQAAGVDTIAALFITHPDLDHWGGLDSLIDHFFIQKLVHGPLDSQQLRTTFGWACRRWQCDTFWKGQYLLFRDGLRVQCLGPDSGAHFLEPNSGSLILRTLRANHGLLLVSGDLDTLGELALAPEVLPVDVLQLGHHGSRSSGHLLWLGQASPRWVVVQAGIDNDYGHPTADALARVRAVGAQLVFPKPGDRVGLLL